MSSIKIFYLRRRRFENSKILGETARFAELLENLNKISKMIQPVKNSSSMPMPVEMPILSCDHLTNHDINTLHLHESQCHLSPPPLPIQTSASTILEDLSENFDITALLSYDLPLESSDIQVPLTFDMTNTVHPYPDIDQTNVQVNEK